MTRTPLARLVLTVFTVAAIVGPQRLAASGPVSVNLSTYIRVGRFDLPEPTRTAAPAGSLLAQEASGITYNWDTDTLFVVGDGGTSVVQVSKTGALIDSMTLAPGPSPQGTDFYDTEGLAYVGGGKFVLIEERYRQVNLFTYVPGGTLHKTDASTVKLGTTVGNTGLEGVSYDPLTGGYILVKEKDPQSIFQTGIDFVGGTATNGSAAATSSTNLFVPGSMNLADLSDVVALSNLPSLSGQPDFSHLLVISQESGQIVNVTRTGVVSSRLTIVADAGSAIGVPDMTMEGIAMDRDGNLYVANENGGGDPSHPQLWVYAHSDAPNLPPTGVSLNNPVVSIPENTSTAAPIKVAEVVVTDDGLGQNDLAVAGPDAAAFQIIGAGLYLRAGTPLDSVAKPTYVVSVTVDDTTVGLAPDASVNYLLTISQAIGGTPALVISEVAPWSSGNSPQPLRVDWFEVTNVGTAAAVISGWKMDDGSSSFGSSVALNGITTIAPGESVIFMETADLAGKKAAFLSTWFGGSPPAHLQVGSYSGGGVGLSTDGDGVSLFNGAGVLQASVTFGASTPAPGPFRSFDNSAGLNNALIATLSFTGINNAFAAASDPLEIGSPGTVGAPPSPVVTISALDSDASEGGGTGTFRIARTGSTVAPLVVNYTVAAGPGEAAAADYTPVLTGAATVPSGAASVDLVVTPVDDVDFEGPETVTVTVFDTGSYDVGDPATASITIADNDPPNTTIDSSPATPTTSTSATFTFSSDGPASALSGFECSRDGGAFAACASPITYAGLLEGMHTFAVRAVAKSGLADPTPASFSWIVDRTGPAITLSAELTVLWPPNGGLVPDAMTGTIEDALSGVDPGSVAFRVVDEYGAVQPAGGVPLGSGGAYSFTPWLDAARLGADRDGRVYQIIVTAKDLLGNQASASVIVTVPHDQGK